MIGNWLILIRQGGEVFTNQYCYYDLEAMMLTQTMIKVWYRVSGNKVLLGEAHSDHINDLTAMWLATPPEQQDTPNGGYRMSLFDDGGKAIGEKEISVRTAELLLSKYANLGNECHSHRAMS